MNTLTTALADRLRALRTARDYSGHRAAELTGTDEPNGRREHGFYQPGLHSLRAVAEVFDVTVGELLGGVDWAA